MTKISIIINNYNYGRFLAACIDSALMQSYPNTEVIVVDDGSTDDSREIIARYTGKITAILKENGGQGSAYNAGFNASHGDIVIFLDSDDLLHPGVVQQVVASWSPQLSKIHWRLDMMDERGKPLGQVFPASLHEGDVREHMNNFGCYASPPGSANAFSAAFLKKVLPMPEANWRIAADTYVILLAPFYGEIANLPGTGGLYRLQDKLDGDSEFAFNNSPKTPPLSVARTLESNQLMWCEINERGLAAGRPRHETTPAQSKIRLISFKFFRSEHPVADENLWRLLSQALVVTMIWPGYKLATKAVMLAWFVMVGLLPRPLARYPAVWLVNPQSRPRMLRRIASIFISK